MQHGRVAIVLDRIHTLSITANQSDKQCSGCLIHILNLENPNKAHNYRLCALLFLYLLYTPPPNASKLRNLVASAVWALQSLLVSRGRLVCSLLLPCPVVAPPQVLWYKISTFQSECWPPPLRSPYDHLRLLRSHPLTITVIIITGIITLVK